MSQENQAMTIELINENGQAESFDHIMTLEYKERVYMIMHPLEANDLEDGEVVVFSVTGQEEGQELYEIVQDEALAQEVFDEFLLILESDEEDE